jgi:hypothetical protein
MTLRNRGWVLLIALAPVILLGTCYVLNHDWWQGAEAAVAHAVTANTADPADSTITVRVPSAGLTRAASSSIETLSADNMLVGTTLLDLLSPGVYVAHVRAPNGRDYHVEAIRETRKQWRVTLMRPEQ